MEKGADEQQIEECKAERNWNVHKNFTTSELWGIEGNEKTAF